MDRLPDGIYELELSQHEEDLDVYRVAEGEHAGREAGFRAEGSEGAPRRIRGRVRGQEGERAIVEELVPWEI